MVTVSSDPNSCARTDLYSAMIILKNFSEREKFDNNYRKDTESVENCH